MLRSLVASVELSLIRTVIRRQDVDVGVFMGGGSSPQDTRYTGSDGRYQFTGVPDGTYKLGFSTNINASKVIYYRDAATLTPRSP